MTLNMELLQLYRCKQLIELLDKTGQIFSHEGFPHVSLSWSPAPGTLASMLENTCPVWDNYSVSLATEAEALGQAMASSLNHALEVSRTDLIDCLDWKFQQTSLFLVVSQAPKDFHLSEHQRRLIEEFGHPAWQEFISYPVCRERDRVLFLTARTQSAVSQKMLRAAHQILDAFMSAYRYLHSQSITPHPEPSPGVTSIALSRREVECLQWLASGKTLSEAATILGISERTLRFHVGNARDRLGVATTMQAVVAAALAYGFDPNDTRRSIYTASRVSHGSAA